MGVLLSGTFRRGVTQPRLPLFERWNVTHLDMGKTFGNSDFENGKQLHQWPNSKHFNSKILVYFQHFEKKNMKYEAKYWRANTKKYINRKNRKP